MRYIDQVHEEKSSSGYWYITKVRFAYTLNVLGSTEYTKQEMIDYIKKNPSTVKTKYKDSVGNWCEGEFVRVVDNRYLRTDNNNTPADNLDNLIKY